MPSGHQKIAKVSGEENLKMAFEDLFHVMVNLRFYTKEFDEKYGVENKRRKHFWQEKADKLIQDLVDGNYTPLNNSKRSSEENKIKSSSCTLGFDYVLIVSL